MVCAFLTSTAYAGVIEDIKTEIADGQIQGMIKKGDSNGKTIASVYSALGGKEGLRKIVNAGQVDKATLDRANALVVRRRPSMLLHDAVLGNKHTAGSAKQPKLQEWAADAGSQTARPDPLSLGRCWKANGRPKSRRRHTKGGDRQAKGAASSRSQTGQKARAKGDEKAVIKAQFLLIGDWP